jgi:hypothetical protein
MNRRTVKRRLLQLLSDGLDALRGPMHRACFVRGDLTPDTLEKAASAADLVAAELRRLATALKNGDET